MITAADLAKVYRQAHNIMRNVDGLQPQEALDELLKYLFYKQSSEFDSIPTGEPVDSQTIRELFTKYLETTNSWSNQIWKDKNFHLTDEALESIHSQFKNIQFLEVDYDIRSHAIREFMTPEIRKGLGIFLTPDEVVKTIVKFMTPFKGAKVLDPACGSGTFLTEYLNENPGSKEVHGFDKSGRMLLLADLNLGHYPQIEFNKLLADSLKLKGHYNSFDLILTNPPFGVTLDSRDYDFNSFETCKNPDGYTLKRQGSELPFIEQCINFLKPGGHAAIIIPRSIANNSSFSHARERLAQEAHIYSIMSLPPETFSATGTQTSTLVICLQKYQDHSETHTPGDTALATITNVGFDSTGRPRKGSELPKIPDELHQALQNGTESQNVKIIHREKKLDSFKKLDTVLQKNKSKHGKPLSYYTKFITTGKTPPRKEYTESGNFLIKVGNLTGSGLNWEARDRNFISDEELKKRKNAKKPMVLEEGDILLTSSAHSPVYIGKKSDIFTGKPDFLDSGEISLVGEVMLVRIEKSRISPYLILAYLKDTETISEIQSMVRGQTAHLHSSDLENLIVPNEIFNSDSPYKKVAEILERESELNKEKSELIDLRNKILSGSKDS